MCSLPPERPQRQGFHLRVPIVLRSLGLVSPHQEIFYKLKVLRRNARRTYRTVRSFEAMMYLTAAVINSR